MVILGDLIDRGPHSAKVIKYLRKLKIKYPKNVFVIIGNHEVMMREYIFDRKKRQMASLWGYQTIEDMKNTFESTEERNQHLVWLANLGYYCMDEEYLYVHAGFNPTFDLNDQSEDITFTEMDEMYNVSVSQLKDVIGERLIVHGHTPYPVIYSVGNFISCDTGASVFEEGKLSLVELNSRIYYLCNLINFQV